MLLISINNTGSVDERIIFLNRKRKQSSISMELEIRYKHYP